MLPELFSPGSPVPDVGFMLSLGTPLLGQSSACTTVRFPLPPYFGLAPLILPILAYLGLPKPTLKQTLHGKKKIKSFLDMKGIPNNYANAKGS